MKVTQKHIRAFVAKGFATNISTADVLPSNLKKIMFSVGVYGINGALYEDENGNLYAITCRCSNLFRLA